MFPSINELLEDTDSEMEDDSKDKKKKPHAKSSKAPEKGGKAWLHEGDSEEIMDFMDINAAKKVMSKSKRQILNPVALRKAKIVYNFGLSECSRVKGLTTWYSNCSYVLER